MRSRNIIRVTALLLALATASGVTHAQSQTIPLPIGGIAGDDDDLTDFTLEELMNIEVTVFSPSVKQRLSEVPAAVYVLTGDEIRRAGHSSIPEALRMVPGIHVSHWTNSMWDVTARGYGTGVSNTNFAFLNQLLVMIDGVPVYSPLFAGTWWALQDIDMTAIDRIEIIRGPGGIVWGTNAVHGVVHVITKKAKQGDGTVLNTWYGTEDRHYTGSTTIPLGENGAVRVWGKASDYDTPDNPFLGFRQDFAMSSAGFRADYVTRDGIEYDFWGRAYRGRFRNVGFDLMFFQPFSSLNDKEGGQVYLSRTNPERGETWSAWFQRDDQNIQTHMDIEINQLDLEYKRVLDFQGGHHVTYGLGYRHVASYLFGDDPFFADYDPRHERQNNLRAFGTDTITLTDDVQLLLGVQLEDNEFTGLEVQPSIRGTWQPTPEVFVWGAISRAVRTPSLEEVSLTQDSLFIGDPDFESEELLAYELGTRWNAAKWATVDLALFWNFYDKLHNDTFDGVFSSQLGNTAEGEAYGGEIAFDLRPTDNWHIRAAYSRAGHIFTPLEGSDEIRTEEYSPKHLYNLRSYYDLGNDWEFDIGVYGVDGLRNQFELAEYWRGDARLGWKPSETLELGIGIQNFDDPSHSEFDDFDNIPRQAYFTMSWTPGRRNVD